jgi:hypothetical protein
VIFQQGYKLIDFVLIVEAFGFEAEFKELEIEYLDKGTCIFSKYLY